MTTVNEINAAFDKIYPELQRMVSDEVPIFFRSQVVNVLNSTRAKERLVNTIRLGLDAAEKARR